MDGARQIEVFARSTGDPDVVWGLLVNAIAWGQWARVRPALREREGLPAPDGVGSIRRLGPGPFAAREEVVAFEPTEHFAYTLLSGLPVREYRADVHLSADGDGTLITWRARVVPKIPGTGAAFAWFFRRMLTSFANGLARAAARP
jgi:Polyketide cyclase / dehydrase and lipid transport